MSISTLMTHGRKKVLKKLKTFIFKKIFYIFCLISFIKIKIAKSSIYYWIKLIRLLL